MIKIPADRAKAAEASLPTLVDAGRVFLRIRRTQANGGSNSTAVGSACCCCCCGDDVVPLVAAGVLVESFSVADAAGAVAVSPEVGVMMAR